MQAPTNRDTGLTQTLNAVTRSTTVTQFIPDTAVAKLNVAVWHNEEKFEGVEEVTFKTIETKAFDILYPVNIPEAIGVVFALSVALFTGLLSDVFQAALYGSLEEYGALAAWGVGADQAKNLVLNLNRFIVQPSAPSG